MPDARLDRLRAVLQRHPAPDPPIAVRDETEPLRAAVAVVIRPRSDLELLLVRRAEHDADPWSGHVALPGGRMDDGDTNLLATAIRETAEEVSIALSAGHGQLGALAAVHPATPRLPPITITPFVFAVPPETRAHPDEIEIAAARWAPIGKLRREEASGELKLEMDEEQRTFPSLTYEEYVIWGLTHRIVTELLDVAARAGV